MNYRLQRWEDIVFFLIVLDFILFMIFLIASLFFSEKNKRYTAIGMLGLLTFLSAFRYGFGADYFSYEQLYYYDYTWKEPLFNLIVFILKSIGFSSQMMFLIYSCLTGLCFWKAITSYFTKGQQILLCIMIYAVNDTLWVYAVNGMRQGLSVVLILWAVSYLLKNQYKQFVFLWIVAVLGHYAALVALIMLICNKIHIRKLIHIILMIISFFLGKFINLGDILVPILYYFNDMVGIGGQYIPYLTVLAQVSIIREGGTGLGILFTFLLSIIIVIFLERKIKLNNFICNMITLAISIKSLFWFSEAFLRLRHFFEIFLVIGLVLCLEKFNRKARLFLSVCFIFLYVMMELNYAATNDETLLNYMMNFNLLE